MCRLTNILRSLLPLTARGHTFEVEERMAMIRPATGNLGNLFQGLPSALHYSSGSPVKPGYSASGACSS